ncbi:hypothetical protein PGQ11_008488 [Apiospora arundinis]|uniref:Uncharacterized protein n=1 Tax=Apiospora arundinis TaxID=335852 RepID=A0ABR2IGN9_9PEZI
MPRQNITLGSSEGPCPTWVHDATILLKVFTHQMVDQIQRLRRIDQRYQLEKPWLSGQWSIIERAQFIMQRMEHKPWRCGSEEDFMVRLESYIRHDFLMAHGANLRSLINFFVGQIPRINDGYEDATEFHRKLRFRAYTKAVLVLVFLRHGHIKAKERPAKVNTVKRKQVPSSTATITTGHNNNDRSPMHIPGSWPSNSRVKSKTVQKPQQQQQQADNACGRPVKARVIKRKPVSTSMATTTTANGSNNDGNNNNNNNNNVKRYTLKDSPLESLMESEPVQQLRKQQKQQQQTEDACCYREQESAACDQPTGKTWLERHSIHTTFEPRTKKQPIGISRRRQVTNKVRKWFSSPSHSEFRMRRGGSDSSLGSHPGCLVPTSGELSDYNRLMSRSQN